MSEFSLNSKRAFEEAKAIGGRVVLPEPHELQIDIDSSEQLEEFKKRLKIFDREFQLSREPYKITPSKSGRTGKWHITIELCENIDHWQRIALQACLGSDPIRELLSACRLSKNDPHPTLFIEK